ncbi:MAG: hypothetical protein VKS61_09170 [Candidatus Sericytochromatia bacterium]|nr:hypothetical protein [Candidatus Sericytochromatia bacterium]
MRSLFRSRGASGRGGFTLIEVALAALLFVAGTTFAAVYFKSAFEALDPRAEAGGLRRYMMAEHMLRCQAEGLRVVQRVPADAGSCRVVAPPTGSGYSLEVTQHSVTPAEAGEVLHYFDFTVSRGGKAVSTLSMSTLRRVPDTVDDKIGL